jgi:DNA polymerase III alpha subunit (gram-positive type)
MNNLFIDVETTGLDPDRNAVIQIACSFYKDKTLVTSFEGKFPVTEKDIVDLGALQVNKFNYQEIFNFQSSLNELVEFLLKLPQSREDPIILSGHNILFDITALKKLLKKNNIEGLDRLFSYRIVDTSTLGEFLRHTGVIKLSRMSLANLAKALGIVVDETILKC